MYILSLVSKGWTLEMWLSGLRLESLFSAHLEHCCSCRKEHWMMGNCEAVTTYQCLLQQLYQKILDCSQTSCFTENMIVKMTVSEDLIRRGLGQNRFYCGLTDLRAIPKRLDFLTLSKNSTCWRGRHWQNLKAIWKLVKMIMWPCWRIFAAFMRYQNISMV